jgi:hypothetical protein
MIELQNRRYIRNKFKLINNISDIVEENFGDKVIALTFKIHL